MDKKLAEKRTKVVGMHALWQTLGIENAALALDELEDCFSGSRGSLFRGIDAVEGEKARVW